MFRFSHKQRPVGREGDLRNSQDTIWLCLVSHPRLDEKAWIPFFWFDILSSLLFAEGSKTKHHYPTAHMVTKSILQTVSCVETNENSSRGACQGTVIFNVFVSLVHRTNYRPLESLGPMYVWITGGRDHCCNVHTHNPYYYSCSCQEQRLLSLKFPKMTAMAMMQNVYVELAQPHYDWLFVTLLLLGELMLGTLIISKVPYTEIDWVAYMQEVDFWWKEGEYDYRKIYGATGPLVYPAGFLYLFRALQYATDQDIPTAQIIFLGFYIMTQAIVMIMFSIVLRQQRQQQQQRTQFARVATSTDLSICNQIWSFRIAIGCLCLSKRYHSIYLLRLFNDGPTMLMAYISFWCFMNKRWNVGCFMFSLAVSLKMNILLFAPGLLYLLLQDSLSMTIPRLAICGVTQLILGAPFLLRHPVSYLRKAFELDRQFFYQWTVNFKFLPEDIFLSKEWAILLLLSHLSLLAIYHYNLYHSNNRRRDKLLSAEQILSTLFISNFIGICCARTLHYQFYSWYFASLPFLLWRETTYSLPIRLLLLACIEYAFLTFPATGLSSSLLQIAHWSILIPCVLLWRETDGTMNQEGNGKQE
jgi:alpha-1,3-mannosyltransferase